MEANRSGGLETSRRRRPAVLSRAAMRAGDIAAAFRVGLPFCVNPRHRRRCDHDGGFREAVASVRLARPGLEPSTHPLRPQVECAVDVRPRSEEHTSELQSHHDLVCRLLLEKKKKKQIKK